MGDGGSMDAGRALPDASVPDVDAGPQRRDGGSVGRDAGAPDAGPACLFHGDVKVVLYGDSITTQHALNYDGLFEWHLDNQSAGNDFQLIVEGYPGEVSFVPGTHQPRDFVSEVIDRHHPDIVVLFWGMNTGCNFDAHEAAYRAMIPAFQAAGIVPVILTTIPVCSSPYRDTRTGMDFAGCGLGYQGDGSFNPLTDWWCHEEQVNRDRALLSDPAFANPTTPLLLIDARAHLQDKIAEVGCCTPMYFGSPQGTADGVHMLRAAHDEVFSFAAQAIVARTCPP